MSIAWLKNRLSDLKYFFWLGRNWRYLKKDKYSPAPFIKYWFLYLVPRLIYGTKKAPDISRKIINRYAGGNLIVPLPVRSANTYYIGIRDASDFDTFREVCINDHYNLVWLKSGLTVIDVGAHIGLFAIPASVKVGQKGKVVAIEPEVQNFHQLERNLDLNKIENVIPLNTAISDFNGKKDFFITKGSGCHSFSPPSGIQIVNKVKINVKTLDTLLRELNIKRVDFLKIDTEGAELEILKGAKETLSKNPQMKMIIASYHYPHEALKVAEYLRKLNFSTEIIPGIFTLVAVK